MQTATDASGARSGESNPLLAPSSVRRPQRTGSASVTGLIRSGSLLPPCRTERQGTARFEPLVGKNTLNPNKNNMRLWGVLSGAGYYAARRLRHQFAIANTITAPTVALMIVAMRPKA